MSKVTVHVELTHRCGRAGYTGLVFLNGQHVASTVRHGATTLGGRQRVNMDVMEVCRAIEAQV